jgi:hypothetical protein
MFGFDLYIPTDALPWGLFLWLLTGLVGLTFLPLALGVALTESLSTNLLPVLFDNPKLFG